MGAAWAFNAVAGRQVVEYFPDFAARSRPELGNLGVEERHPGLIYRQPLGIAGARNQVLRSETNPDRSASSTSLARFWFWARSSTPNL